jgi:hypothetical protein
MGLRAFAVVAVAEGVSPHAQSGVTESGEAAPVDRHGRGRRALPPKWPPSDPDQQWGLAVPAVMRARATASLAPSDMRGARRLDVTFRPAEHDDGYLAFLPVAEHRDLGRAEAEVSPRCGDNQVGKLLQALPLLRRVSNASGSVSEAAGKTQGFRWGLKT